MKKWYILLLLVMAAIGMQAQKPWDKGGFETQQYRNLFVEMGYNPMAVERKL